MYDVLFGAVRDVEVEGDLCFGSRGSNQGTKDGAVLSDEMSDSLALVGVRPDDSGAYTVEVSNSCGTVTSDPELVAVSVAPVIKDSPSPQQLCVGDALTLIVSATGSPILTYQWFLDGQRLDGETGPTLMIPALFKSLKFILYNHEKCKTCFLYFLVLYKHL